ncbi:MAG: tetratricopeptide repeat protein [Bacteroidales bacterium]|nr:tetratricopeptide repeat protein [Bacteroidales bacterium]MCF8343674.1 tetratricopeptide repeat protein [Bacteroidales bacterium]MCF8351824.1 tetratricopeptide repeat protein [Bacteroidales bacterium]
MLAFVCTLIIGISVNCQDTEHLKNAKTGKAGIEDLFQEIIDTMPTNPQYSMALIKKADSIVRKINNIKFAKKVDLLYAKNNYYIGNYNRSLKHLNKCLGLNKQEPDSAYLADVYYVFATNHNFLGNYDSSLYYATGALKIYEALQNTEKIIITNNVKGLSHSKSNSYEMALRQYKKSLALAEETGNIAIMSTVLNNIATMYYYNGKYDTASIYYMRALDIALETDNKKDIAMLNQNLGNIEWINGNFQEALNYYKKALYYDKLLGLAYETSLVLNNIGGLYGVELKDYEKADQYLSEGLYYARNANAKGIIRGIYKAWYDIYLQRKNYKTALEYFRKYSDISDSIYNETKAKEIARLREDYEAEKREKEIGKLNLENQVKELENKRQQRLIYSILGFVLFAAVVVLLLFNRFKLRQKHKQTTLRMKNLEFEHKMLLSQMNPHFIFIPWVAYKIIIANKKMKLRRITCKIFQN